MYMMNDLRKGEDRGRGWMLGKYYHGSWMLRIRDSDPRIRTSDPWW